MQARYYDPGTGRFLSVDPVAPTSGNLFNFGRYDYANNNPIINVDPNGQWPKKTHEEIIDKAFPGLSKSERSTLKSASSKMDSVLAGGQAVKNSFEHSMRAPSQSVGDAKDAAQNFIKGQESKAQTAQGEMPTTVIALKPDSLTAAGNAIHTATDSTSPAHTDANGNPEVWTGLGHVVDSERHVHAESTISPDQMKNAVNAAQGVFKATYGDALYNQATQQQ